MLDVYEMAKKVVSFFPEVKVRVKEASGLRYEFSLKKLKSLYIINFRKSQTQIWLGEENVERYFS